MIKRVPGSKFQVKGRGKIGSKFRVKGRGKKGGEERGTWHPEPGAWNRNSGGEKAFDFLLGMPYIFGTQKGGGRMSEMTSGGGCS